MLAQRDYCTSGNTLQQNSQRRVSVGAGTLDRARVAILILHPSFAKVPILFRALIVDWQTGEAGPVVLG